MKSTRLTGFLIVAVYIAAMLTVCMMNFSSVQSPLPHAIFGIPGDKAVHFLLFIPFSPLVYTYIYRDSTDSRPCDSFYVKTDSERWKNVAIRTTYTFISGATLGGIIEILQLTLTSSRSAEFMDWVADLCGIVAGFALVLPLRKLNGLVFKQRKNLP